MSKADFSVVVPVFNSENTLEELFVRIKQVFGESGRSFEVIFVEDGGPDNSWHVLTVLKEKYPDLITAIKLNKNFGQHNALMCGFSRAKGKYLVTLDDDLQNPPEEIQKLFKEIQNGYDVVYGIYDNKKHTTFRNIGSIIVQLLYRKVFNVDVRITSFRIMKREIVEFLLSYEKSFTFIDGIIAWYTTKIKNVTVEHQHRNTGESGHSMKKLVILALNMVTNFSIAPLQIASLTGTFFAIIGFIFGTFILIKKIFFEIYF